MWRVFRIRPLPKVAPVPMRLTAFFAVWGSKRSLTTDQKPLITSAPNTALGGKAPPPATERVIKDTHKSASKVYARQYSPQLLEAIDWCLQVNQLDRPQSAQELLDFLNPMKALELKRDDDSESLGGFRLPWRKG